MEQIPNKNSASKNITPQNKINLLFLKKDGNIKAEKCLLGENQ